MQLYLMPIIVICFALLLMWHKVLRESKLISLVLAFFVILSLIVLISIYRGNNTDWQTYRDFVDHCGELGCTYFEPGFDLLTFISAETLGFNLIKIFLILFYAASIFVVIGGKARPFTIVVTVASISVAALPLMLGAIRQSLTLPLLLWAAIVLERQRYRSALIAVALASSLHYSALAVSIWYGIFWRMFVLNPPSRFVAVMRIFLIGIGTYSILFTIMNIGLGELYTVFARIGETGAGTDYINTGGLFRDVAIIMERFPFSILSLALISNTKYYSKLSEIERVFLLMYIAGSIFFISTFGFDRNIAGRTLATFRLADVYVMLLTVLYLFNGSLRKFATLSALAFVIIFVISKSYMTLVTVGFFDE